MNLRIPARGLAVLAASGLVLAGCGSDDGGAGGDGPRVLAAFYPLAFVAERVAGDLGSVENLTQPGTESHDLELTAQQVGSVSDADLILFLDGFQPAVDDAIDQNGSGTTLDAASVVDLLPEESSDDEDGHDHEGDGEDGHEGEGEEAHDDGHDHDGEGEVEDPDGEDGHAEDSHEGHDHSDLDGDPHLWLDPANMAAITDSVADALAEMDPDNADAYRANAEQLSTELDELDEEFSTGLAQCDRSLFVVSHEAFGYLADRYGLDQLGVAGLDPESEPSPARVAEVQDIINDEGVTTIFHERLTSPEAVEGIANDLGLEAAVLDPVEGLTDETSDEDYFSLMRANLEALKTANGCSS